MYKDILWRTYYDLRNEFRRVYGKTPLRVKNAKGEIEVGVRGFFDIIEVVSNRGKYCFAHDVKGITAVEVLPWPYEPRNLTESEVEEIKELALDIIRGGFTQSC